MVKAIPIQEVLELSTKIRARLKKELGPSELDQLKVKEPRLVQLAVDLDFIITSWSHQIMKGVKA